MDKNISINQELIDYIFLNTENIHEIQADLLKYNENLGRSKKLQLSILQANFLQFLIKTKKIKNCLEVGTFTGYSTLSMALSIPKNGKIISIDKDANTQKVAKNFLKKANLLNKVKMLSGNGLILLKDIYKKKKKFDLIFIDADKENYINYFDLSVKMINQNGLIIIDNTLWKGEVLSNNSRDKFSQIIRNFNDYVKNYKINKYIIPLGDGFTVCFK